MFCPFCKAEFRSGIAKCSDCTLELVESVPENDSDPNFMVVLWNGESLAFLETVCSELDKESISIATPRVDVLLRDTADRYHLRGLKTFSYVVGVRKSDFPSARKTLETVARSHFPTVAIPPVGAYPEPYDERVPLTPKAAPKASLEATTTVFASCEARAVEFLEASLDGVNIPFRRMCLQDGTLEVQVRPTDEELTRGVLKEIADGSSSQLAAAQREADLLRDDPPESYFLAWFLPSVYFFLLIAFIVAMDSGFFDARSAEADLFTLELLGTGASILGMIWMVYQAMRYEVHPFRYCVAALLPLTFVWYYVERVMRREGEQRLPVSVRARMPQPPA